MFLYALVKSSSQNPPGQLQLLVRPGQPRILVEGINFASLVSTHVLMLIVCLAG